MFRITDDDQVLNLWIEEARQQKQSCFFTYITAEQAPTFDGVHEQGWRFKIITTPTVRREVEVMVESFITIPMPAGQEQTNGND